MYSLCRVLASRLFPRALDMLWLFPLASALLHIKPIITLRAVHSVFASHTPQEGLDEEEFFLQASARTFHSSLFAFCRMAFVFFHLLFF